MYLSHFIRVKCKDANEFSQTELQFKTNKCAPARLGATRKRYKRTDSCNQSLSTIISALTWLGLTSDVLIRVVISEYQFPQNRDFSAIDLANA